MHSQEKKQIKVAVCDTGLVFRGGQRQSLNLLLGLHEKQVEVVMLCPHESDLASRLDAFSSKLYPVKYNALSLAPDAYNVAMYLKSQDMQIFQASESHSHTLAILIKYFYSKIKLVVTVRTCLGQPGWFSRKFKYAYAKVDMFVAVSTAVKDNLITRGVHSDKIIIIPSSYNPVEFNRSGRKDSKKLRIGSACSLEKGKGLPTIISALIKLREENIDFSLTIAGEGPDKSEFVALTKVLQLQDKVSFVGFVYNMAEFYRNLDVYVLASHSEGLGSSLIEAGACGAIPVGCMIGGIPDVIDDKVDGYLFEVDDSCRLGEILVGISKNPEICEKLNNSFYKKLAKFDINNMIKSYIDIYQRIIG